MTILKVKEQLQQIMDEIYHDAVKEKRSPKEWRGRWLGLEYALGLVHRLEATVMARIEEILAEDERAHQEWDGLRSILGMKLGEIAEERRAMIAELQKILGEKAEVQQ